MMSDVSPEDRERLVDIRFGELFDRHMDRRFAEVFDQRLMEWADLAGGSGQSQPPRATYNRPLPPTSGEQQPRQKRRSLFEISLAETLGLT